MQKTSVNSQSYRDPWLVVSVSGEQDRVEPSLGEGKPRVETEGDPTIEEFEIRVDSKSARSSSSGDNPLDGQGYDILKGCYNLREETGRQRRIMSWKSYEVRLAPYPTISFMVLLRCRIGGWSYLQFATLARGPK